METIWSEVEERYSAAKDVGIDISTNKARKILENVSIPIASAILQLVPEGGPELRKLRFAGDYGNMSVATDSSGVYRTFPTTSGQTKQTQFDLNPTTRRTSGPTPKSHSPDEMGDPFALFAKATQRQMDEMKQKFDEQMTMMAHIVQRREEAQESKKGHKQVKKEYGPLGNPPPPPLSAHSGHNRAKRREKKPKFNGAVKNYKDGAKRQRQVGKIELELEEATAVDGPDVLLKLKTLGYAIIKDYDKLRMKGSDKFESLFAEQNRPTPEQAMFYDNCFPKPDGSLSNKTPQLDPMIFEGVRINAKDWHFKGVASPAGSLTGRLPRTVLKNGLAGHKAYNNLYSGQMDDIITKIFTNNELKKNRYNPAALPQNWNMTQNIVLGGVNHQHPHCDQAKAGAFLNEPIFPFVAIHGFGVHNFEVWLLPAKKKQREYGFLAKLDKKSILFMRGDFVHAGSIAQSSRSHLEFFPLQAAGWPHQNSYWGTPARYEKWKKEQNTFLIPDLRSYPFAYPTFSEQDGEGYQVVTYPPERTAQLVTIVDSDDDFEPEPPKKRMKNEEINSN